MDAKRKQLACLSLAGLLWLAAACGTSNRQAAPTHPSSAQIPAVREVAGDHASPVPRPTTEPYCKDFPETNYRVCDYVLTWWEQGGGLQRFGLPITDAFYEAPEGGGDLLLVQYFEKHIIRLQRPQPNQNPTSGYYPVAVELGKQVYKRKYPEGAPNQVPNKTQPSILFGLPDKGPWLGGRFSGFWGNPPNPKFLDGSEWFGNPISDEFLERNEVDGKEYRVQYFEDAALEYHPENKLPDDVQFAPLGLIELRYRYPGGTLPQVTPTPRPYVTPAPGYGCWSREDMPPSNPTPGITQQQAEEYARRRFPTSDYGKGEQLGPLTAGRHVSVDASGPDSDYQLFEDAWVLYFELAPHPRDDASLSRAYGIYVDSDTGEVLPGCEWTMMGAP